MARARRAVAALGACAALALAAGSSAFVRPAGAQGLRTLHVDALAMRVDKPQVHLGETFHLAIHVHVRERVPALDELVVPDVGSMLLLGDERHVSQSSNGTEVIETLTLEPRDAGAYTFPPAYLDAIDARSKRPSRFSAAPVRVVVLAAGTAAGGSAITAARIGGLLVAALAVLAAVLVAIGFVRVRRRRAQTVVDAALPIAAPAAPDAAPLSPRDEVAGALRAYRSAPADGALTALRTSLFAASGVAPGATLRDALASARDARLRAALLAAEDAAFGPAAGRDGASRELIDATQKWLG